MPTLKTASSLFEQEQQQQEQKQASEGDGAIQKIIARFPYKEYGLSEDKRDNSLVVSMPNGMKIRVMAKTIQYYSDVAGGDMASENEHDLAMRAIEEAWKMEDVKHRTFKLKEVIKHFAQIEFKPDKYSFTAYLLGQTKLPLENIKELYFAYAADDASELDPELTKVYSNAISYCLSYYKFLAGMLTVIG